MQNEPVEVTLKVTDVFEKLGVPYLIGGSLASTLYGMVRTTQDSDVIAEMRLEHLKPFVAALQDEFYLDDEMIVESIQRNSSFNIIHRETMFKVDVFIPRPRPFLQSQLARAQRQVFTFESGSQCKICQSRRHHPLQTRMVPHGRRSVRSPVAGYPWRTEKHHARRTRPGLSARMGGRAQSGRPAQAGFEKIGIIVAKLAVTHDPEIAIRPQPAPPACSRQCRCRLFEGLPRRRVRPGWRGGFPTCRLSRV